MNNCSEPWIRPNTDTNAAVRKGEEYLKNGYHRVVDVVDADPMPDPTPTLEPDITKNIVAPKKRIRFFSHRMRYRARSQGQDSVCMGATPDFLSPRDVQARFWSQIIK
jgi:hypothetical protein